MSVQEQAVGYATLILQDQNIEITADKLTAICKAAGVALEPFWAQTFERVLKGRKLEELLTSATSGGGGGGGGGAAPAAASSAPAAAAPAAAAEPEKPAKEESEEGEMELDLFG